MSLELTPRPAAGFEALLQSVLYSLAEPACVVSREAGIVASNDAWGELGLDRAPGGIVASLSAALGANAAGAIQSGVESVLEGARVSYSRELTTPAPSRSYRLTATALRHGDGGALVVLNEIGAEHLSRDALRVSEHRAVERLAELENFFQTAPVGLSLIDREFRFVRINERLAAMNGTPMEEHIGRTLREVIPDVARTVEPLYRRVFETGKPATAFEVEGKTPHWSGTALVSYYPLKGHDGEVHWVSAVVQDITVRKRTEEALKASEAAVRDLAGKLIVAQEEERRRVARELHDGLNQQLAALSVELGMLRSALPPELTDVDRRVAALQGFASRLIDGARGISRELHPSVLEHLGLEAALSAHCSEFRKQTGMQLNLSVSELPDGLGRDASLCLYRVVQEALRNAARHARASDVSVELAGRGDHVELRVVDNGSGFDVMRAAKRGRLGLVSMEERVRFVGGELRVYSEASVGTRLQVRIPLEVKSA